MPSDRVHPGLTLCRHTIYKASTILRTQKLKEEENKQPPMTSNLLMRIRVIKKDHFPRLRGWNWATSDLEAVEFFRHKSSFKRYTSPDRLWGRLLTHISRCFCQRRLKLRIQLTFLIDRSCQKQLSLQLYHKGAEERSNNLRLFITSMACRGKRS